GALILVLNYIKGNVMEYFQTISPISRIFFHFGLWSWIMNVLIQMAALIPEVAIYSFTIRPFVIGFIHLTMLGYVSGLILALLANFGVFPVQTKNLFFGALIFIAGFVLSELTLFGQGVFYWFELGQIPFYYSLLFGF